MKTLKIPVTALCLSLASASFAQTAIEALQFTQSDLKGTARSMSMGGAFGALGGDLSTLSQNPAGIGVYRSNDIGFTVNLDNQHSVSATPGNSTANNQTKFLLNNIGAVFTLKLNNATVPNFNIGFTYDKSVSFNRRYQGSFGRLNNSLSNYIAGVTNNGYDPDDPTNTASPWTEADMSYAGSFNPYFPNDGHPGAPWLSILGYQSFLITPSYMANDHDRLMPYWEGQWGNGTAGNGVFDVEERGGIDSYNIAFGGNIANKVYWGMDFDIVNFNYIKDTYWGENLTNAYVEGDQGLERIPANWNLRTSYQAKGTGFNYKLGIIVKPIQELRIGFAFHTPTWYSLTETYSGSVNYAYNGTIDSKYTNRGVPATTDFNFRSPWKIIASVAGVIGGRFIISADYEWAGLHGMKFSQPGTYDYGYDDWDYGWDDWYRPAAPQTRAGTRADYIGAYDPYYDSNEDIKTYSCSTNTLRIGTEYRVTNNFSVRAGYSYVSSPVKPEARDGKLTIYTNELTPSFRFDNSTNYITCGLGWRTKHFYADLAYVYRHQSATWHAYPSDPYDIPGSTTAADLSLNNHQVLLSMGVKF